MLAIVLALPAANLVAQHAGQFEVGAFGSFTSYDDAFDLARKLGGGARLGYMLGDLVGVEADVLFQPQYTFSAGGTPATMEPLIGSGSLVVNFVRGSRLMLFALGGYSLVDFGTRAPFDFTDNAVHGGAGARIFLSNRIALRVEGRALYAPSTKSTFGPTSATHVVATAGFSVFHLGGPPRDSDKDGVTDKKDACPDTPAGANVDPRGCPLDSDHDVVFDGLDRCPNTPAGAQVDASGCPTDADADGVLDGTDLCPNTPPGATVDASGCPVDADKDGVSDGLDQCPGTPAGALVDVQGCPLDADVDGVPDGLDKCPNTPAGTRVDPNGCPLPTDVVRDADGDGVLDPLDKCPNTPAGSKVDANGCIILFQPDSVPAAPGAPARPTLILRGVNFETGRSVLTRESSVILDQVVGSLAANPGIRIEIAGYTDSTGSAAMNLRLSQARAAAVRFYLARRGISPGRMVARGYGASNYVAPNTTAAGRAQNRRVELHKLP